MKLLIPTLLLGMFLPLSAKDAATPVSVSIQAPHPGYGLEIVRVDNGATNTYVLAKVISPDPDRMYPMVISEISDTVHVTAPVKGVKLFLLKRGWDWGEEPSVDSEADYLKKVEAVESIPFTRPKQD
jgi:hypothetical protein